VQGTMLYGLGNAYLWTPISDLDGIAGEYDPDIALERVLSGYQNLSPGAGERF